MEDIEEMYGGFAYVYDKFMDNIPYDEWFVYIKQLLRKYKKEKCQIVDLACGTGEITKRLLDDGYEVTGIDLSEEMLAIAQQKCDCDVLFLKQDICELKLGHKVPAMVCICDGMNYILSEEKLLKVFSGIYRFLEDGGVFIFDMKTEYFYQSVLGNQTFSENREDASYIWENEYDSESKLNEYLLTVYSLYDDDRDLFVRTDEIHRQRAYDIDKMREIIKKAGLSVEKVYEAFTKNEPQNDSERVYYIVKK